VSRIRRPEGRRGRRCGRHYGPAMVVITPLALLMNQVAAPRPIGRLMWDRGAETAMGAAIAGAVILLAAPGKRAGPRRVRRGPGSANRGQRARRSPWNGSFGAAARAAARRLPSG
jgi:hypothetical protein